MINLTVQEFYSARIGYDVFYLLFFRYIFACNYFILVSYLCIFPYIVLDAEVDLTKSKFVCVF